MRPTETRFVLGAAILAAALSLSLPATSAHARTQTRLLDEESEADALAGLDHLYHGRMQHAARRFERIRERHPQSPAADFLHGGIEWHRVATGLEGTGSGSSAEKQFFARMDAAIELGEAAADRDPDDVAARFFLGGAYGYKARYLALREDWWSAYRTGRRGVKHLEWVAEHAPDLGDAKLGLGIYHYYADVLPSVLKFFSGFLGLHGDREKGMAELKEAAIHGTLVSVEARFFLAELQTSFEDEHWTALGYSRDLRDTYPENELFRWLNGRILDELHLSELALPEWLWLRDKANRRSLRGFLDYRLARTKLYGGDFAGAAAELGALLDGRGAGSRRINAWGYLRLGQALDFLGRHDDALRRWRQARDADASDTVSDRAQVRLDAGRDHAAAEALEELAEVARIVLHTGEHSPDSLDSIEARARATTQDLTRERRTLLFAIVMNLAKARMAAGDEEGALVALDRAEASSVRPSREVRALLQETRARALFRMGRLEEAAHALEAARRDAPDDARARIDAEQGIVRRAIARKPGAHSKTGLRITARDRGEFLMEVETPLGRVPMTRTRGTWTAHIPSTDGGARYRFVVDGNQTRVDPWAPRVRLVEGEAWSETPASGQAEEVPALGVSPPR
ncbi:MAG: tetratricopeptide repeat protein [Gemmatimonadota bacterium]|nr:tetratricopeptide repeat protein [Gemmatimonadota bacterium]